MFAINLTSGIISLNKCMNNIHQISMGDMNEKEYNSI
jgi:hypothetical protein